MQSYRFNTRISEKGIISLPYEPTLFDKDVEIIIITKPKDDSVPEGYMTLEEFRTESKASLMQILNEHDTLFTI